MTTAELAKANSTREASVESHLFAKNAKGWGTPAFTTETQRHRDTEKSKGRGAGCAFFFPDCQFVAHRFRPLPKSARICKIARAVSVPCPALAHTIVPADGV